MHTNKRLKSLFNKLSPVQIILTFYFLSVFVSMILLALPFAHKPNVELTFMDILFTAVSALSVTGLSTVVISETFNTVGIFLLAAILQFGAVGVMAIGTFIWLLMGKRIGLKERHLIMTDQNQTSFDGMVRLIKQIILVLLTIEVIAFLILGTYYLKYYPTGKEAYFHGFFGMISAISNGGFDITGKSLIPFKDDYFVQIVNMVLIFLGAIGFPVLIEVKSYLFKKRKKRTIFRFSLFTKVTSLTFLILIVVGTLIIFLLDMNHYFAGMSWHESLFYSLFQSVTTRSGGLSTLDVNDLTRGNQLFMSFLMFIGASPSSAGGGIRTTTFALVVVFIITYARGGKNIKLFNREIYDSDLLKAVTVTLMAFILVCASLLVLVLLEPFTLEQILFEVTSAFGTVGLSTGITSQLTVGSKLILILLMFIGRVGVISFLLIFNKGKNTTNIHYPKEKIIIG